MSTKHQSLKTNKNKGLKRYFLQNEYKNFSTIIFVGTLEIRFTWEVGFDSYYSVSLTEVTLYFSEETPTFYYVKSFPLSVFFSGLRTEIEREYWLVVRRYVLGKGVVRKVTI